MIKFDLNALLLEMRYPVYKYRVAPANSSGLITKGADKLLKFSPDVFFVDKNMFYVWDIMTLKYLFHGFFCLLPEKQFQQK